MVLYPASGIASSHGCVFRRTNQDRDGLSQGSQGTLTTLECGYFVGFALNHERVEGSISGLSGCLRAGCSGEFLAARTSRWRLR